MTRAAGAAGQVEATPNNFDGIRLLAALAVLVSHQFAVSGLPEPVFGCAIHAYVPLYFNPRNPMLFVRREQQHELVVLRVSAQAVKSAGQALFTDGNAASRATRSSTGFEVVKSATPVLEAAYWGDFLDGRRMRCAEALVLDRVAPHFIEGVACNNSGLAQHLHKQCGLQVEVDRSLFF